MISFSSPFSNENEVDEIFGIGAAFDNLKLQITQCKKYYVDSPSYRWRCTHDDYTDLLRPQNIHQTISLSDCPDRETNVRKLKSFTCGPRKPELTKRAIELQTIFMSTASVIEASAETSQRAYVMCPDAQ